MTAKQGYTVHGTREMIEVGVEALEALGPFLESLGWDREASEITIFENLPVQALVHNDTGTEVYVWTREEWIARRKEGA
jgi:hypothetical protein